MSAKPLLIRLVAFHARCGRFVRFYTIPGGRVSKVLALTPDKIDFNAQAIIFETLKKRRQGIYRAVPEETLDTLNMVHSLDVALKLNKRPHLA